MPDILHRVTISAPPDRVYAALTTAEGVRSWWTHDAELEPAVGGTGEFGFHGRRVVTRVQVVALDPDRRVLWRTLASNAPGGWDGTTIGFDLAAMDGGTEVAFAHRGFAEADPGYLRVTEGWAFYLASLKAHAETGTGTPH